MLLMQTAPTRRPSTSPTASAPSPTERLRAPGGRPQRTTMSTELPLRHELTLGRVNVTGLPDRRPEPVNEFATRPTDSSLSTAWRTL